MDGQTNQMFYASFELLIRNLHLFCI